MRQTGTGPIFASEKRELVQRRRWPALAAAGVYGIAAEASGRRRLGSDRPGALRAAEGIPEIAERRIRIGGTAEQIALAAAAAELHEALGLLLFLDAFGDTSMPSPRTWPGWRG